MPISDKQLAANRRNAQFSTSPKSPEGKERSALTGPLYGGLSLNGFKHAELGLTALMVDEDREAQTAFVREYIVDLDPRGAVELQLARTLAMDNWRLNRIKAVEENIFAWGYAVEHKDCCSSEIPEVENAMIHAVSDGPPLWGPQPYMQYADRINKISLYESRLSRVIVRNTELLEKRQAQRRKSQPETTPQTQAATATIQTNQPLTFPNGFDQENSPQSLEHPAIAVITVDEVPKAA